MSSEGIAVGIGHGLSAVADAIRQKRQMERADRDKEADRLERQMDAIAMNRAAAKQELSQVPKDTPDYVSRQNELSMLEQQFNNANTAYQGLFNNDNGGMIERLKFWHQRKVPKPSSSVDLRTAASPRPDFKESDAYQRHQAGLQTELGIQNLRATAPVQRDIAMDNARSMSDLQTELTEKTNAATVAWAQKHNLSPELLQDLNATLAGIPASLLAKEKVAPKPVVPHISDKMLVGIDDPNTGSSYHAGNIGTAPPEIKAQWEAITKQQTEERGRDEAAQAAKNAEAEKRDAARFDQQLKIQTQAFQNALDSKDYTEARKQVTDADKEYQAAIDRQKTMARNLKDAAKGDQQAMLSLVANHIGMTLGGQKGARINQAIWNEAIQSAPWLSTVAAKFSKDGYLSGVTLAAAQMQSMVNLANEKVDILKDHKSRLNEQYKDVLGQNTKSPADLKRAAKPGSSIDDEIMSAVSGAKKPAAKKK